MTTALVTGAAGLLGRATVDALADDGVEVHALVRRADQGHRADVTWHEVDLAAPIDSAALPGRIDAVLHLAQAREFRDFPASAMTTFGINVVSTATLLDWALRVGAANFVYASSGGVYRPQPGIALTEDAPLHEPAKAGHYIGTKLASEALVGAYAGQFSTAILRYFFIYGPGQERSMLIPRLYDRVARGEAISLQGEAGMRINPVHARDAAAATAAAARLAQSVTANIAGPEVVSLRDIGERFAADLGVEPVFEQADGTPGDLLAATEVMSDLLAAPRIALADALADIRG